MNRYSRDYGVGWSGTAFALRSKSPTARQPLTRQEAARVVAEPFAERASDAPRAIAKPIRADAWLPVWVWLAIMACWAMAWVVAFAS